MMRLFVTTSIAYLVVLGVMAFAQDDTNQQEGEFVWQELGAEVYADDCAACHQLNGQGVEGAFPALAGNPFVVAPPEVVIQLLLNGQGGMPSFGNNLDDQQIAAVLSHVRNTWENSGEVVTPETVAMVRRQEEEEEEPIGPNIRPGAAN